MAMMKVNHTQTLVTSNHKMYKIFDRITFTKWNKERTHKDKYVGTIIGFHEEYSKQENSYLILSDVTINGSKAEECLFYFSEIENPDYEKPVVSKIWDILDADDSIIVFDIDGVLAAYEYGMYNHNACKECEWNDYIKHHNSYENARPLSILQSFIAKKGKDKVFVCSVASENERNPKIDFVVNNYKIEKTHIYFVDAKNEKLNTLHQIHHLYAPDLPDFKIIMVDDTIEVLTHIQDNSNYSTVHISSFME